MKKSTLSFALFSIVSFTLNAQCPTSPIDFLDQASINSFPTTYPTCTFLPDGVDVKIMGNDITDLSPLAQLTGTHAVLEIRECPGLASLAGLENIQLIGNDALDGFILRDLPVLSSISALSNLDSITGEFTIRTCPLLNNLSGLDELDFVNGSVIVRDNSTLTSLQGLNSLTYIGETLEIVENTVLTDVSALSNVDTIVGGLEGGVFIEANIALTSLTGIGNATTEIGSNLDLLLNDNLSLCSVPSICKYLSAPPVGAIITINSNEVGCNSQTEVETGCSSISLSEIPQTAMVFALYSNPINEFLIIETNKDGEILISNALGSFSKEKIVKGKNSIDVTDWSSGIYFIQNSEGKAVKVVKD